MNINLENARKLKEVIVVHSRAGNLALYAEAQEQGLSFSELLEQIDPSEPGAPLDAFERQLMLHGVLAEGPKSISLEQFVVGGGLILLPEYILREVRRGYKMVQDPTELVAAVVPEPGPTVRPIYIKTAAAKQSLAKRGAGSGSAYPRVELLYRDKEADVIDRGREFDFSYRVVRNQKLAEFRVFLWWIGAQMAYDEIDEIYNLLLNGDGTSAGATDVFIGNAGTFAYSDLVHLAMSFDVPAGLTHIVAAKSDIEKIVNLSQFQDPLVWRESELMQRSGDYRSLYPVNARLVIAPQATSTKIIALDARFAVRESVAQPLMIEAEKVINQKLEAAVVSKESVYTVMVDDCARLSDY
ncbi:MAG: hypothetical protein FJY65_08165 [Calditrichaeota bacterium]|nr:hypothetical protein [Calditrichota bacterium]